MAVRSSSIYAPGSSGTTVVVPVPTGAAIGDIAIIGIYYENTAAITPPSGFTLKTTLNTSATARGSISVYWKRLTAADTGSYSFTLATAAWRLGTCVLFTGRSTSGDPFDATPGTIEATATALSQTNPGTTPINASCDLIAFVEDFSQGGSDTWTTPTGFTAQSVSGGNDIAAYTKAAVAAGATGSVVFTSTASGFMKSFVGALTPAGAGASAAVAMAGAGTAGVTGSKSTSGARALAGAGTMGITGTRSTSSGVAMSGGSSMGVAGGQTILPATALAGAGTVGVTATTTAGSSSGATLREMAYNAPCAPRSGSFMPARYQVSATPGNYLTEPTPTGTGVRRTPEQFGAVGDGSTLDDTALTNFFAAMTTGDVGVLTSGKVYKHSNRLTPKGDGWTIYAQGSQLLTASDRGDALCFMATNSDVIGLVSKCPTNPSGRSGDNLNDSTFAITRLNGDSGTGVGKGMRFFNCQSINSPAAGFFTYHMQNCTFTDCMTTNSQADAMHMTSEAKYMIVNRHVNTNDGDDGCAVVSYKTDAEVSAYIEVNRFKAVTSSHGRGLSVVGGNWIAYNDCSVGLAGSGFWTYGDTSFNFAPAGSDAAGLFIGDENDADTTYPATNIFITRTYLNNADFNRTPDQGSLIFTASFPRATQVLGPVTVDRLTINQTGATGGSLTITTGSTAVSFAAGSVWDDTTSSGKAVSGPGIPASTTFTRTSTTAGTISNAAVAYTNPSTGVVTTGTRSISGVVNRDPVYTGYPPYGGYATAKGGSTGSTTGPQFSNVNVTNSTFTGAHDTSPAYYSDQNTDGSYGVNFTGLGINATLPADGRAVAPNAPGSDSYIDGSSGAPVQSASVAFVGANTVGVVSAQSHPSSVAMAGSGTVATSGTQTESATEAFAGVNTLAVTTAGSQSAAIALAGANVIAETGTQTQQGTDAFVGANSTGVTTLGSQSALVAMAGANAIAVTALDNTFGVFALSGSNTLSASGLKALFSAIAMAGAGSVSVSATVTSGGGAPLALVQSATNGGNAATVSVTLPSATAAGALLIALVHIRSATAVTGSAITDSAGNTWTQLQAGFNGSANNRVELWATTAPTGSVTGPIVFTPSATVNCSINVTEWPVGTTVRVSAGGGNAASTNPAALTVTAAAGDAVIGGISYGNTTAPTVDPAYTALAGYSQSTFYGANAYLITGSGGAAGPSWTLPASVSSGVVTAALAPPPGGGATYVAFAGAGTFGVVASQTGFAATVFSGAGTVGETVYITESANVAMSGAGLVGVTGSDSTSANAAMSGVNTLAVTAQNIIAAAIAMSGAGTMSTTGTDVISATFVMSGANTMAVSPSFTQYAAVAMSGSGTMGIATSSAINALVLMAGSGTLGIVSSQTELASVLMSGTGALGIVGSQTIYATALMTGVNIVGVVSSQTETASALMAGAGTVGITSTGYNALSVTMAGSNTTGVIASQTEMASALVTGFGTLGIVGTQTETVTVVMSGANTLAIVAIKVTPSAIAMSGVGTVGIVGSQTIYSTFVMTGANTLAVVSSQSDNASIAMTGANFMSVTSAGSTSQAIAMSGANTIALTAIDVISAVMVMSGANTLAIAAQNAISAAVAMSGANTLGIVGTDTINASAAMTGANVLAESISVVRTAAIAMSGANTMVTSGYGTVFVTLVMNGSNTLAIAVQGQANASIAMSGANTLGVVGYDSTSSSAAFTGTGSMIEVATKVMLVAVAMSGANTMATSGSDIVYSAILMSGANTLAIAVQGSTSASVLMSGVNLLAVAGLQMIASAIVMSGANTLAEVSSQIDYASATMSGVGVMAAIASLTVLVSASMTGSNTLGETANNVISATAAMSGANILAVLGMQLIASSILMSGTGTVAISVQGSASASVAFVGSGTLAATAGHIVAVTAILAGAGILAVTPTTTGQGAVALAGAGYVGTAADVLHAVSVLLSGYGTLGIAPTQIEGSFVTMAGANSLSVTPVVDRVSPATMSGYGTLGAVGWSQLASSAAMAGFGTMDIYADSYPPGATMFQYINGQMRPLEILGVWTGTGYKPVEVMGVWGRNGQYLAVDKS